MSENTRRPLTSKVHLYQALYLFNRGFEITLLGLKRLEELGLFREENSSSYEVRLKATRAEANEDLTGVMQGYEEDDSTYWDNRYREREKEMRDPDDVFFDARRKQEIREQIKELQSGLARQQPRRQPSKRKRRKPKRPKQKAVALKRVEQAFQACGKAHQSYRALAPEVNCLAFAAREYLSG